MKEIGTEGKPTDVELKTSENAVQHSRREAIQRLAKLGIVAPTATVLINMSVNNAFAEPGS